MASQAEAKTREYWGAEKSAAFDRFMARLWVRAAELVESGEGADLELHVRIARGRFTEGRFDPDEKFA